LSPTKVKTFLEFLKIIHSEPSKARKYLLDKRLTQNEKKIIQAWYDLKNCLHEKIFEELNGLKCENELIESQRKLIIGLAKNNQANFSESLNWLKGSLEILEKYPLKEHHFICIYNLFIVSFNLSDKNELDHSFKLLESLHAGGLNPRQELCFKQCRFNYYNFHEMFDEGQRILEELEGLKNEMSEAVIMSHQISKFIFYLKQENYDKCQTILKEMKEYRLFRYSPNYKFMKMALDHLDHNAPLYIYEKDFKEAKNLYHQLKTIQGLEEANLYKAKKHWEELQKENPDLYQHGFEFRGQKNLLSLCLDKHRNVFINKTEEKIDGNNKAQILINILMIQKKPIPKEILFLKLWGYEPKDELDDNKLRNLIYYVKKTKNIKISYRKGCYQVIESNEKTA
jgi:hypothetical protein